MATTLDGKIAKGSDHGAFWTSKADKKLFVQTTQEAGVIVMGKKTYDTIGKPLPGRLNVVSTRQAGELASDNPDLIYTNKQPQDLISYLKNKGYDQIILGGGTTLNTMFLEQNLIDEIWLTIEPKLFGEGLNLFKDINVDLDLELIELKQLTEDVLHLRYRVQK